MKKVSQEENGEGIEVSFVLAFFAHYTYEQSCHFHLDTFMP